jgi:hypothetical protein
MICTRHQELYLYEELGSLYKSSLKTDILCLVASVTFLFSGNINIKLKRHFLVAWLNSASHIRLSHLSKKEVTENELVFRHVGIYGHLHAYRINI